MSRNLGKNPVGKAAPAVEKSQQPAPKENFGRTFGSSSVRPAVSRALLVCEPKGKWDEKVVA